jgi:DNA-directed RNA polymerase specialized sigma24 family protein
MEEEILARIDRKLDAVVRLLASRRIEGLKSKTEAITALGALGLDANLISEIVDTTPGTVSARLSEVRRKGKAQTKKVHKKKVESNE